MSELLRLLLIAAAALFVTFKTLAPRAVDASPEAPFERAALR